MESSELNQHRQQAAPHGIGVMHSHFAGEAENATLQDIEGNEMIDFAAGIAVLNTGHRHPKVVTAVVDQLQVFTHTAYQIVPYESYVSLAEHINDLTPIDGSAKTAFFTTGTEAVGNTVKIARAYTGRPGLITFGGGFHGRIFMIMTLTGKVAPYKIGFGPFPGSAYHGVYPNEVHGVTTADTLKSLERISKADITPDRMTTIILEPIQGEGDFDVAPADFMQALCDLYNTHSIPLVADEVQTGFARADGLFTMQHYEVKPDLMTMAKSLAGDFPLSGVVGHVEMMDAPAPGRPGGTYVGGPLAVAAAYTMLDVIAEEQLCQRIEQLGSHLQEIFSQARATCPATVNVRGRGLMVAMEFNDPQTGEPSPEFTRRVQQKVQENDLLLLSYGVYGNVIRFLYPLTVPDAQSSKALDILTHILRSQHLPDELRRRGSRTEIGRCNQLLMLSVNGLLP